jgi:UDPglucose 6-dehydrogenase
MNFENDFPKIGIVGLGFVGSAIRDSIDIGLPNTLILVDPPKGLPHTYKDLASCEAIFVCVPSPSNDDGSCDTSILEETLERLKEFNGVIISKTTAPPSVYEALSKKYKNLVHAPEFLTAANASRDYANGTFAIIGGSTSAYIREAERIIKIGQTNLKDIRYATAAEASLAKYAINCFLSTKVIFMNELFKVASVSGINYNNIINLIKLDPRIGNSHMQVPGPDGAMGFGGMCFPKDTAALLKWAEEYGQSLEVLNSAVKKNTLLRLTDPK